MTASTGLARCLKRWWTPDSMAAKAAGDSTRMRRIERMQPEEVQGKVRAFIARRFKNLELRNDEDIFAAGFVNSLFAMQLVLFVEKEFQVNLDEEDLQIENFRTIDAVAGLALRKAGAGNGSAVA